MAVTLREHQREQRRCNRSPGAQRDQGVHVAASVQQATPGLAKKIAANAHYHHRRNQRERELESASWQCEQPRHSPAHGCVREGHEPTLERIARVVPAHQWHREHHRRGGQAQRHNRFERGLARISLFILVEVALLLERRNVLRLRASFVRNRPCSSASMRS